MLFRSSSLRRIIRDCNDEVLLNDENATVLLPHFSCHSLRHTLPDFSKEVCEMIEFEKKLSCLTNIEKKRIIQFCKHQFTISEIAEEEGISKASASRTIARAIKKIKKFWKMG